MARCEDFPCCGHEAGCCPDFDPETGKQLNMKCVCGATVPLTSKTSLCAGCLGGRHSHRHTDEDDEPRPAKPCPNSNGCEAHDLGDFGGECDECEEYLDGDQDVDYGDYEFEMYGYDNGGDY